MTDPINFQVFSGVGIQCPATWICNWSTGKWNNENLGRSFDRTLGREEKKWIHSRVKKILPSSCFPGKRSRGFGYNASNKVGIEFHLIIEELKQHHGWFQTCIRDASTSCEKTGQQLPRGYWTEATSRRLSEANRLLLLLLWDVISIHIYLCDVYSAQALWLGDAFLCRVKPQKNQPRTEI